MNSPQRPAVAGTFFGEERKDSRLGPWAALKAITPADAAGYFTHCGYPPLAQAA